MDEPNLTSPTSPTVSDQGSTISSLTDRDTRHKVRELQKSLNDLHSAFGSLKKQNEQLLHINNVLKEQLDQSEKWRRLAERVRNSPTNLTSSLDSDDSDDASEVDDNQSLDEEDDDQRPANTTPGTPPIQTTNDPTPSEQSKTKPKKEKTRSAQPTKSVNTPTKTIKPPIIVLTKGTITSTIPEVRNLLGHRDFSVNGSHIQTKTIDDFEKIKESLKGEFHTFPTTDERKIQLVICRLCPSTTVQDIWDEFNYLNLIDSITDVSRFTTEKSTRSKKLLPLWRVSFRPGSDVHSILKRTSFLNQKVRFERIKTRTTPQCGNCKYFGHTSAHCSRSYRCIKCILPHPKGKCSRPGREDGTTTVACVNCKETGHPANFRGCKAYIDVIKRKQDKREEQRASRTEYTSPNNHQRKPNVSFADSVKGQKPATSTLRPQQPPAAPHSNVNNITTIEVPTSLAELIQPIILLLNNLVTRQNTNTT